MKTKLLSLFLALAASVEIAFASVTIDGIYYNLNETELTAEVTSGSLYAGDVVIPSQVTYDAKTYSVTSIGYRAFFKCDITSVTIPNNVTSIGDDAFSYCSSLTSVTIGNSVTSIGDRAFDGCRSLTSINVANDNPNYSSKDGVLFNKQQTTLIQCPGGMQGEYVIPNSVTSIGDRAFYGRKYLTSVTIPNSVTSIGQYAFSWCSSLTSVTIGNSVTSIGNSAFMGCSSLTSVTIPNSVTSIGDLAFSGCSSLTSVEIPNSVTRIRGYAFDGCSSLTSVTIPNSVTSIGVGAFQNCRIVSINFTGTIEEWCNKSWSPTQISSGYQLFINGVLQENVTIPNSVTNIGGNAFNGCSNLKNILFGTSVKVIEASAISNCPALETITCYSMRPPTVNNGTFQTLPNNIIIFVPADYLNTYKMHDFWGMYDVRTIGAATTETTSVQVTPSETAATVAWPTVSGAETYEMVIKDRDGNVVCTLIFNANGQLTQIAFGAPARDNASQAAGFAFTVTGLEEGTSYDLTITAKDGNGTTLDEKTIAFTTSGETGVDALQAGELRSSKVLRNGEVLILRDGKMYNLQGVEVK